jgi:GntR family transcriptional regulator, transcriptional repressor for pyruvate dehydrogenase complex
MDRPLVPTLDDDLAPRANIGDDLLAPVRRHSVSDDVAERLISSIVGGRFKFGERLPPERDLAKYLDVGRPAVREAIRALRVLGLVDVRQGDGTYIVDNHAQFVARAFGWALLLDPRSTREVVEVRVAIETQLARLAAERVSSDQVAGLEQLVEEMEHARGDSHRYVAGDIAFHLAVANAAGNIALEHLIVAIQSLLREWIQHALGESGAYDEAQQHHRRIVAAIKAKDPDAAELAMRAHIEETAKLMIRNVAHRGQ